MADIRIGFVPIARPTFDLNLARELTAQVYDEIHAAGYSVIGSQDLVMDGEAIDTRIAELSAAEIDMILMLQSTFADSTMVLQLCAGAGCDAAADVGAAGGAGRRAAADQFILRHQPRWSWLAPRWFALRLHLRPAR